MTDSVFASFPEVLWVSTVCQKRQELEAKSAFLQGRKKKEEEVIGTLSMLGSATGLQWRSADLEGIISIDQYRGAVCA